MAKEYNYIIVLATQPDPETWEFPKQIKQCVNKAAELFEQGAAPYIIASGNHAVSLDYRGIKQPYKECDELKKLLVAKGVPEDRVLIEADSRDTISNLYYLKEQYFLPNKAHKLLFVVASFRVPRLKFLCKRILGVDYQVSYKKVIVSMGPSYNEKLTTTVQTLFLEPMKDGDHRWLDGKFFDSWLYRYWRERSVEKYGKPLPSQTDSQT